MPRSLLSVPPRSLLHQLVPKDKRKIPPRKTAPRMPGQAEGKDPKKPSESKKDPANPGEVKKGSRKPREGRAAPSKKKKKNNNNTGAVKRVKLEHKKDFSFEFRSYGP